MRLMNDAGLIVITAFISPYRADRALAKEIIGSECFREVYVSTPLSVCESRDPKGMYSMVRARKVTEFTGISSPYESPHEPDLVIDTPRISLDASVSLLAGLAVQAP
ncbi:MAG: adenylyl-sulfate kinase [Gallionellaceae bacterium]|nr:adenylyl-sulfate kinase [Gallionellaceae bacterium]